MGTVWFCVGVAALIFGFGLLGLYLQTLLPEPHSAEKSREMIGAVVGLVSLLLALVLGTLVGSTYAFYANQKAEMETLAARALQLDIALSEDGRNRRRPQQDEGHAVVDPGDDLGRRHGEGVRRERRRTDRAPETDGRVRRLARARDAGATAVRRAAGAAAGAIEQTRLLVLLQLASPVSWPLVAIVVSWATILFCGFGVLSRFNATTVVAVALGAFAVGSALFLILELSQPFTGVFLVPSGAFDQMLASLGK